ncbi:MAG: CRISPR-associated endonuclease Cas1 [Pseudobdellovibrio sp.]
MSKSYTQIDEKQPLIPLSRRVPIYYVEYCKIIRSGSDVRIVSESLQEEYSVPVGNIGSLILGPGTSATAEAMRIITSRGCSILVAGGEASPLFLSSTQHRSPISRIRQFKTVMCPELRLRAGKRLFKKRAQFIQKYSNYNLPKFPDASELPNIESLLAYEGVWAKQSYKMLAKHHGVTWTTKQKIDKEKHPIVFLNFLSYSIADICILHLGYDPNIGILHGRTKGGGLCYDLADIVKPILALELSFESMSQQLNMKDLKSEFMAKVRELDVISYLVDSLTYAFGEDS